MLPGSLGKGACQQSTVVWQVFLLPEVYKLMTCRAMEYDFNFRWDVCVLVFVFYASSKSTKTAESDHKEKKRVVMDKEMEMRHKSQMYH